MMFAIPLIAAALAASGSSAPAASVAAQPTGKWVVDFGDYYCMASHGFSIGADKFAVGLRPTLTTDSTSLWVTVPKTAQRLDSAQVAVAGVPVESKGMALQGVDRTGRITYAVRLTKAELLRLIASGEARVTAGKWSSVFPLARLAEV